MVSLWKCPAGSCRASRHVVRNLYSGGSKITKLGLLMMVAVDQLVAAECAGMSALVGRGN